MAVYSIYFSPTGGTRAVMEQLTTAFGPVTVIDLCRPDVDFSQYRFSADDTCLIGVPSYGGLVPPLALQRLDALRADGAKAILVAVYGNREIEDTLTELDAHVQAAGFTTVGGVKAVAHHSLFTQVAVGRPDAEDIAQLRDFSVKLKAAARDGSSRSAALPGNRPAKPQKGGGMVPALNSEACTRCGLCAARCPAQAIDLEAECPVDAGKCAHCMRCVSFCPTGAIALNAEMVNGVFAKIGGLFAGHKTNELYL